MPEEVVKNGYPEALDSRINIEKQEEKLNEMNVNRTVFFITTMVFLHSFNVVLFVLHYVIDIDFLIVGDQELTHTQILLILKLLASIVIQLHSSFNFMQYYFLLFCKNIKI